MGFHGPCIGMPTRAANARNVGNCIGVALAHFNSSLRIKSLLVAVRDFWDHGASARASHLAFFVAFGYRHRQVRAASVPIPKFASPCNTLSCELRNQTLAHGHRHPRHARQLSSARQRLWACEAGLKCLGRKLREEGRLLYRGRVGIYVGRPCNSAPACSRLA